MAEDSKREQILVAVVQRLNELSWPRKIQRARSTFDKLAALPNTQFPFIGVVGGLPSCQPARRDQQSAFAKYLVFISTMRIEIIVYDMVYDDDQYDRRVSNRVDDLWAKVHEDPSFGSLLLECLIEPEPIVGVWDPYLAFKMTLVVKYNHETGGI